MKILICLKNHFVAFAKNQKGSFAVTLAFILPLIITAAGVAMDTSEAYLTKKRLGQALDASALAAAGTEGTYDELYERLEIYLQRNYSNSNYPMPDTLNMTLSSELLTANATTTVKTSFMKVFGKSEIEIYVETEVKRDVRGVEVVMVLDNTGSMAGSNIAALKTASENFVNILFDGASNDNAVKIGLVPYATSVNVGTYGLGQNPDGSYYGESFVNNPLSLSYDTSNSDEWHGCVLAEDSPDDTLDHNGPWDMYRYCRDSNTDNPVCDYSTGGRRGRRGRRGGGQSQTITPNHTPNYNCSISSIMPMNSDRNALLNHISDMGANGNTLGNYGLVWGWRVISPEFPFEEGADYDSRQWDKVIIMMTDGINTMHHYYSAYGQTSQHNISAGDLDTKMEEVCENIKDENITIYTVTFASGVNENTKDYFRNCASSPDKYHDAPTQDDLVTVFEQISRELSNLYISK